MAKRREFLIVFNPTSGRGRGRRTAVAVAARLRERGAYTMISETAGRGDAERIVRAACGSLGSSVTCVVGCGGDGTMQEVANALADLRKTLGDACPTMGLAPVGRCNDFAGALGVSTDVEAIVDVLDGGAVRPIDLGCVNGRYFCTVATLGVDAEVSRYVDTMRMPLKGTLAYVYAALRVLARYRPRHLRITVEFGTIEQAVFLASSANTSTYGGAIEIAPDAVPTDGLLDLCIIDRVSKLRAFSILPMVLMRRHTSSEFVHFTQTKQLRIESDEELEVWADGEFIAGTPVDISVARRALRVLVPKDGKSSGKTAGLAKAAKGR